MRTKAYLKVFVVLLAMLPTSIAVAGMAADADINSQVQAKLTADHDFNASTIAVETKNGEVTLKGVVASQRDVNRAAKLAHYVEGGRRVDNRLTTVKSPHYPERTATLSCVIGDPGNC